MKTLIKKLLYLIGLGNYSKNLLGKLYVKLDTYNRRYYLHRVSKQTQYWKDKLINHDKTQDGIYGYGWGDPENPSDRLGNYKLIKDKLSNLFKSDDTVLEIGCLGGKWTQYLKDAKLVIGVDLSDESGIIIKRKFPSINFVYYKTSGNELKGIEDNTVNLIFSMDTFGHMSKKIIASYFSEISRVLMPEGRIYMYLPCSEKPSSNNRGFALISKDEIIQLCKKHSLHVIEFDLESIIHGIMLFAYKEK